MKRKMKCWLSLVLAMVLLCGTLPVAFAAETGTPLYEQMGYESADAFMQDWYFDRVDYDWVCARYEAHLSQLAADPEKAFEQAYYGWDWAMVDEYYDSREAFLRDAAMQLVQLDTYEYVPPVSVQLNGETVAFPDAQPEMVHDRTMVPFRAIAETLGAAVDYDSGAITAVKDGTRCDFALGGDTLTLSDNATGAVLETVTLDAEPYEKDGRTYVPVRFFAEAFGLTVQWDNDAQTAVLYDRDALVEQIDARFTVVNRWLAAQPVRDPAQTMRTAAALRVLYTAFNTIDGDETTVLLDGTLEVVDGSGGLTVDVQVDLYGLAALFAREYDKYTWDDAEKLSTQLAQWQEQLQNARLEMVWDAESGILYLRCPLLMKLLAETSGVSMPQDKWIAFSDGLDDPLTGQNILAGTALLPETALDISGATIGTVLVTQAERNYAYSYSDLWGEVQQAADPFAAFAGDDCFTQSGAQYSADLSTQLPDEDGYVTASYTLDMSDGSIEGEVECRLNDWNGETLVTLTFAGDADRSDIALSVHVKNESLTEITLTLTQQPAPAGSETRVPLSYEVITSEEIKAILPNAA